MRKKYAIELVQILKNTYPDATCSLDFKTPFQIVIAVMLSAQCTDERVNQDVYKRQPFFCVSHILGMYKFLVPSYIISYLHNIVNITIIPLKMSRARYTALCYLQLLIALQEALLFPHLLENPTLFQIFLDLLHKFCLYHLPILLLQMTAHPSFAVLPIFPV